VRGYYSEGKIVDPRCYSVNTGRAAYERGDCARERRRDLPLGTSAGRRGSVTARRVGTCHARVGFGGPTLGPARDYPIRAIRLIV
jgi:hypothetical protein